MQKGGGASRNDFLAAFPGPKAAPSNQMGMCGAHALSDVGFDHPLDALSSTIIISMAVAITAHCAIELDGFSNLSSEFFVSVQRRSVSAKARGEAPVLNNYHYKNDDIHL